MDKAKNTQINIHNYRIIKYIDKLVVRLNGKIKLAMAWEVEDNLNIYDQNSVEMDTRCVTNWQTVHIPILDTIFSSLFALFISPVVFKL